MRLRTLLPLAAGVLLAAPAAASADFLHVVAPGESLTSVAATDGLSVAQLAAANGISTGTQLIAGAPLAIPPQGSGVGASSTASTASPAPSAGGSYVVQPGDTLSAIAARAGVSVATLASENGLNPDGYLVSGTTLTLSGGSASGSVATPTSTSSAGGSYVVQPGDTLTAIAAREGMSVAQLAALNGLDAGGYLISGSVLRFSGASAVPASSSSAEAQPVGSAAEGAPTGPPYPTPETVSASEVGSIAADNGVPASLAQAIGWQESGYNNDLVSSAGARGVMQILPGTWQWINSSLASAPLSPYSAADNVRGGVLMLHSLLDATGGSPSMAAAGYYQGLPSVQKYGLFADTQQYVNDVMSLASSFGGG